MHSMNPYEWEGENALRTLEAALSEVFAGEELQRARMHVEAIRDQVMACATRRQTAKDDGIKEWKTH